MKRQPNSRPVLTALERIASLSLQYISLTLKEHSIIEINIDQTSKEENHESRQGFNRNRDCSLIR